MFGQNGCNTKQHLEDPFKEWQKWLNGYEAQNEGTGPYLSHTYTPLFYLKMRGSKYYGEVSIMYSVERKSSAEQLLKG